MQRINTSSQRNVRAFCNLRRERLSRNSKQRKGWRDTIGSCFFHTISNQQQQQLGICHANLS